MPLTLSNVTSSDTALLYIFSQQQEGVIELKIRSWKNLRTWSGLCKLPDADCHALGGNILYYNK